MANETKQKRGPKKGSSSFELIKLSALMEALPRKGDSLVPVRRKWIEDMEKSFGISFVNNDKPLLIDSSYDETETKVVEPMTPEEL